MAMLQYGSQVESMAA